MQIKLPPCYDVSHWEEIPDFSKVSPRPALFITKATEGTTYRDDKFIRFFAGMNEINVLRGSFHFFRKAYSALSQAQNYCDFIRPYTTNKDLLILDVEEGGETATSLQQWFGYVNSQFPDNRLLVYSRKNLLDPISMTSAQKEYFKKIPVWSAGYPYFPDLYNSPPSGYIPDQSKWGKVVLWQYSDKGVIAGIQGNTDVNWIDSDFLAEIASGVIVTPPTARPLDTESHTTPFEGVEHHRVFHFGSWCSVVVIDPQKMRFTVTPFNMRTTSRAATELGAQITINGGAHTALHAIGLHVSEGKYLATQSEYEPFINFTASQVPQVEYYDSHVALFNALAGKRMIVEYGDVSPNNSAAWYEVHPRTLAGMDALGRVVFCTIDGRQAPYSAGTNLFQSAEIMVEYGCVKAIDLDGGGSTTLVIEQPDGSQKVLNYPIDMGIIGKERAVGNHIAVFTGDVVIPPPNETGDNMYEMTPINSDTRIRANHNTFAAVLRSVAADVIVSGDTLWTADASGTEVSIGDQWLLVTKVGGFALAQPGWMARTHKGKMICDNFKIVSDTPQTNEFVSATLTRADGTMVDFLPKV